MWNGKFQFLSNENEVENYIEIRENFERISFVHFCEFRAMEISMETLYIYYIARNVNIRK